MQSDFFKIIRKPLAITSWTVFAVSLFIYILTLDPGVSYWDCPEYVTAASRLEIGHPPGNPVWMLIMRVATMPFPPSSHALVINFFSAICMAFAGFFLCRIIFIAISRTFYRVNGQILFKQSSLISGFISSGSSFCYTFCDSTWYSAVEAEVYAMSALMTSIAIWLMIKWFYEESKSKRRRILILVAYLTGLSLGVHQLNLLCIPLFALIIFYRKFPERINLLIVISGLLISIGGVAMILMGLLPLLTAWAGSFELFFINRLGFPYNSGVLIFIGCIAVILILLLTWSWRSKYYSLQTALWMVTFLLIGFSSFGIIMIRSEANPFMNEGVPSDIFALSSYMERDQYPSTPLIYGPTPYSRPMFVETFIDRRPVYSRYVLKKEKPIYNKYIYKGKLLPRSNFISKEDSIENAGILKRGDKGYLLSDYRFSQVLTPELDMWFPRITSRKVSDRIPYAEWAGMTEETMDRIPISETIDSTGRNLPRIGSDGERSMAYSFRPTYGQNLRFFLSYQAFYMYFRYLFWNFMGRQNDYPSTGEIEHGNFITGVPIIDKSMIGNTELYPSELWKENAGHNNYYSLPFILGVIGLVFLWFRSRESRRILTLITVLFIMTGLAIVIYLNQLPGEPRERDYSFLGSYMAFVMWIAAGIYCLSVTLVRKLKFKWSLPLIFIISFSPASLMAIENYDDHDRSNRFEPTFYATSFLDFEEPALIFSHGDNSTFPLWYAYEVLYEGKEHLPIDITYMGLPSYIINLQKQGYNRFELTAQESDITYGAYQLSKIPADSISLPIPLSEALSRLYSNPAATGPQWPTSLVRIPYGKNDSITLNLHDFSGGSSYLPFRSLILLDLLDSMNKKGKDKILFFPYSTDYNFYKPLDMWLKPALFGKIYSPEITDSLAMEKMKISVAREIRKLDSLNIKPHYSDPVIADRSRRYRGEMIIAAVDLMGWGDSLSAENIVNAIEKYYPYSDLSAGAFTIADSTFYEGYEYLRLMENLKARGEKPRINKLSEKHRKYLEERKKEWFKFYNSLTPSQREKLSNRSRRHLKNDIVDYIIN